MKTILFFIFVFVACGSANNQNRQTAGLRDGYSDSLKQLIEVVKKEQIPDRDLLLYCIPLTSKESQEFHSIDYIEQNSPAFRKIRKSVVDYCTAGDVDFIDRYLVLSQFVDGYFADYYFASVEEIIKVQKAHFCDRFNKLKSESVRRLLELYEATCN